MLKSRVAVSLGGLIACVVAVALVVIAGGQSPEPRFATVDPANLPVAADAKRATTTHSSAPTAKTSQAAEAAEPPEAAPDADREPKFAPHQIIVRYNKSATSAERAAARRAVGGKKAKSLPLDAELLTLPKGVKVMSAKRALAAQSAVRSAMPDMVTHSTQSPNDPYFGLEWGLQNTGQNGGIPTDDISATSAWNTSTGSDQVIVAVIDTGVDYNHSDLANNMWENSGEPDELDGNGQNKRSNGIDDDNNGLKDDWRGWDFNGGDNDPIDDNLHGTHVAGTIGAEGNNNEGISGVGWNTKVMNLKASDSSGNGSMSSAIAAMGYAASKGARVVNGSFGYETYGDYSWESDLIAAYPNTLFVFAAGNSHIDNDGALRGYPCSHAAANIVCVAASDSSDNKASFSNYGKTNVDLAAPGVGILSTKASVLSNVAGNYIYLNGTSMATPHVAGAAAVLLAAHPSATTADLKEALVSGADPVPAFRNKVVSDGRLNLQGSLDALDTKLNSQGTTVRFGGNRDIYYNAAASETNNVTVTQDANHIDITDPGNAITTGPGCYSVAGDHVRCNRSLTDSIKISTGDGDDSVQSAVSVSILVELGDGDDTATTGDGDDTLNGGPGADTMSGGAGDDTVDYSGRNEDLSISFDNDDNDGTPTEGDDINANIENAIGGNGADTITAGNAAATLSGGPGDDIITGSDFNDVLKDGPGADQLIGGAGDDQLFGTAGDGDDVLSAGTGTDVANYSETPYPNGNMPDLSIDGVANDGLLEEQDNIGLDVENLIGSDYGDILNGSDDANVLSGGGGYDSINGRGGDDDLQGDVGADTLDGGPGEDVMWGGSEYDTVNYASSTEDLQISLDGQANDGLPSEPDFIKDDVEHVSGGQGNDTITGSPAYNRLEGGPGDDSIDGADGGDELIGGGDSDVLSGGAGFDEVEYPGRTEPLELSIDGQDNDGEADEGDDIRDDIESVVGGYGNDTMTGGDNDDFLFGEQGDDEFFGGDGNDTFIGRAGNDVFHGEAGSDRVSYEGYDEGVTVTLDGQANDGKPGETDLVGTDVENLWGTIYDDTFIGDDNANILVGVFGSDTIHGGDGNDEIDGYGWTGDDDHLFGDAGDDEVVGGTMQKIQDPVWRFAGPLYGTSDIHGGTGNDKLYGSIDGSEIFGDEGDDLIQGLYATDQIAGGDGSDTVSYHYTYGPVNVSLDGAANDGMANENDAIAGDIENVIGSWGKDTITGNANDNELLGHRGDDTVTAGGGDDVLNGGIGTDTLDAGDGDDLVTSIDDYIDTVNCGAGADAVVGDANESLTADCEQSGPAARVEFKHEYSDADVLEFRAVAGVANNVSVVHSGTIYTFTDSGGALLAGRGCTQNGANSVSCADPNQNAYQIDIQTRDGNDTIDVDSSVKIFTDLDGGGDDDLLLGGGGMDFLYGGWGGNDELYGRGGEDIADYREISMPVTLSPNDIADDGAYNETDNIHSDIEELAGGYGNDTLYGNDTGVLLYGYHGNDKLISGLGDDLLIGSYDYDTVSYENRNVPIKISQSNILPKWYLFASDREKFRSGQSGEADGIATDVERIVGGSAADTANCHLVHEVAIDGGPQADDITNCETVDYGSRTEHVNVSFDGVADEGEAGENDILREGVIKAIGGSGDDTFSGDAQENSFTGGAGDDQFATSDASADSINCGAGADSVVSDGQDTVDPTCESISGAATVYRSGGRVIYSTSGNVGNNVSITGGSSLITVSDTGAPIEPGYGCESISANVVACVAVGATSMIVSTDAGDDSITNDTGIAIHARSGTGNDSLRGGTGADTFNGGDGTDTVSYNDRSSSVAASANDMPDDGAPGEGDNVAANVENLTGGSDADTIVGNAVVNSLDGLGGDDTITGTDDVADAVLCGTGNDTAYLDGNDTTDGNCETVVYYSASVIDNTLHYSGQPGEVNDVVISRSGDDYLITDSAGLTNPGAGCAPVTSTELLCNGVDVEAISLATLDGDDKLHASVDVGVPVTFNGGDGVDTVSYADQTLPLYLNLDGTANDGATNDRDSIEADVENLIGGAGDDYHYGSSADNTFFSSPGADYFYPSSGTDTVSYENRVEDLTMSINGSADDGATGEHDNIGAEVERMIGGNGADAISVGYSSWSSDANELIGGPGNDTIDPGTGVDTVDGGTGDDQITTSDGQLDGVTCGDGDDYLQPDNGDSYGADCEHIYAPSYVYYSPDPQYGDLALDTGYWDVNNDFTITKAAGEIVIHDSTQAVLVDESTGCTQVDGKTVSCPDVDIATFHVVDATGNDSYTADSTVTRPITFTSEGGDDSFTGGSGNDRLHGTNDDGDDTFNGGNGTDTIDYSYKYQSVNVSLDGERNDGGSGENDLIANDVENAVGSYANDTILGGDGNNTLNGYYGNDVIDGKLGADSMLGGNGVDTVTYADRGANLTVTQDNLGNDGDGAIPENDNVRNDVETVEGGSGDDTITTGTIANTVRGNAGNDVLSGGTGADTVYGGAGNDTLIPGDTDSSSSNDTLDGGADVDTANYSARVTTQLKISLDDVANDGKLTGETDNVNSNVENIFGGGNADTLEGSDGPNTIDGGDGNDTIDGKLEADVINGGNGTDTADYSARSTGVQVSANGLPYDGEQSEGDNVATDIENITGGSGPDFLVGNASNNILSGGLDGDVLMGGPSTIAGTDGDDTFNGGNGFDYVTYSQRPDDLQLSIGGAADGASGESDNITASIEAIQAGFGNDTVTGDMYANTLEGSVGDDVVTSGDGNDVVSGGPGANTLDGGAGNDDIVGGDDADTIHGGDGDDMISGGAGNDTLDGELGYDRSVGDVGDDNIESRDGQFDENYCDDGNDTAHGDMWDVFDNCETSTNGPDTTIDSPADGTTFNTSSPAFTFSSNETPPTFECMIDGAAIGPCFSGDPLPAVIEDGPHTIEVVAYDQWGNYDQSPAARTFTVDTQGPTVDVTAPTGVIASTVTPTIAFSAIDESGVTGVTCSMDGETPITCASGMIWPTSLAQGVHTLTVSATDGVGNVGTGASQFTIDTTPPDTIIDSGPSGYTNQSSPTFTFHGTPAEAVAEYECSLDGANYSTCVSPKQHVGLSQGPHTFDVRAKNFAAVIDPTPAHHDFTVDNVQPAVTIASPTGLQTTATPVVTFSVADASPVNSTCSLDYVALPSCTNGMTLSSLANGTHNFAVSSIDAAGNAGTAYVTFVVDTTAPDVSVSGSTLTIDTTTTSNTDGRNGIAVNKSGSVYTITESISPSLKAGAGCTNVTAVQVTCGDTGITALSADLGDGNDNYSGGNVTVPGTISGGNGNDSLAGGTANEMITGGDGGDYMSGGGGTDTLSYADHSTPITASLDGNIDNGSPGEGDSTQPDVENIIGGSGNDLLRSNSGNNSLAGGGGTDTVTFAGLSVAINANLLTGVATGAGSDAFTSIENLIGGNGADALTGDGNNNVIDAGSGPANDTINGGGGTDTVSYASANAGVTVNLTTTTAQNTVGAGTDTITNTESLTGSGFNDTLLGTTAANAFNGLAGADTVSYASGASSAVTANLSTGVASGGSGADTLAGVESLTGSSYADNLQGDASDNVINGGTGTTSGDVLNGNGHGSGGDTVDYTGITSAVTVNLATTTSQSTGGAGYDTITNMENVTGGSGGDTLTGTTANNTINGAGGTDRANYSTSTAAVNVNLSLAAPQNTGGAGTDTLLNNENVTGGSGNDTLAGTTGNNSIIGGSGTDTVSYAAITGNVTLNLGTTSAQNTVSADSDTISSIENSIGGSGNDTLTGSTGNNTITGGPGNDVINTSSGTDTVSYETATAGVTVNLATTSQQNTVGAGLDTITNTENLTGSNFNDTLSGSTGNNVINALLGIDTVSANSGNDTITVKDGLNDNTTTCGLGTDTVSADVSGIGDATATDCETVNRSS